MYLVKWNEEDGVLEASLGGHVTIGEAQVFTDSVISELAEYGGGTFTFVLDYSKASRLDDGVMEAFHVVQTYCKLRGAHRYVCVARNQDEIEFMTRLRLQQVLEGEEEYQLAMAA